MKKINKNMLKTTNGTEIKIESFKGHLKVKLKTKRFGKVVRLTTTTSVHENLNSFERKATLIHFYKLVDKFIEQGNEKVTLKDDIKHCNYAEIFGSPWN